MLKGNLLIVDDEPLILKMLCMNLEDYADNVFTACDGLVALEILKKEDIHCVICDANMPRLTGIELIKQIRSDKNLVPFILYTGHGNSEMMTEVAKYGAFDFFKKPEFKGLDESLVLGLNQGLNGISSPKDKGSDISEYHKILNEIENSRR